MAAEETAYGEIQALERAPFAESLQSVLGAGRSEPAGRRLVRRNADLIEADERNEREDRYLFQDLHGFPPYGNVSAHQH